MKKIIAIDGNSLLFKAYYATAYGNVMQTSYGEYTNALYSFINMINKIQKEMTYDYILVAFDASKTTFRTEQFTGYKETRSKAPDELVMQFPMVREYLDLVGIANYELTGYEADDILGTIAAMSKKHHYQLDIISSDKDLLQLLDDDVSVLLARKGITVIEKITPTNLKEIWDITPKQVIDLKGLMGDPSDNIPGVKGVGEKTAIKLLQEYQSMENLYDNLDAIKGKLKDKLFADRENAFMSKELATIVTDLELPFTIEDLSEKEIDFAKLKDFYHHYELKSLLAKVQEHVEEACDFTFRSVIKMEQDHLVDNSFIDLISLNDYYHKDRILGLGIINETGNYFIKISDLLQDELTLEFLKLTPKYTYDLKKNIVIGYWHGIEVGQLVEDIMIGCYLIDCNMTLEANALVDTNFNISTMTNKDLLKQEFARQVSDKMKQLYYLNKMVGSNHKKLEKLEITKLYQLELAIANILAKMEKEGILLDSKVLEGINREYQMICDGLEQDIYKYAKREFNINSVKQLGEVLFEDLNLRVIKKTKTGYSTDNDVLNMLYNDHPIIPLLIDYRMYKKLLSTYIIPMPDYVLTDNRVHTIYNQCLTATGRLSSKEPNLQNIATRLDIQRSIKKSFVSKAGYSLVSFDYSQIELRILASFAHDPVFIKAFRAGLDIHRSTAANVAGISENEVSDEQRKAAKAINFGIVYGISDFGLAKQLGIARQEAREFIEKYNETYPSVKTYLDNQVNQTMKTGHTRTILNRIRYINEIKSNNHNIKEMGKRMALNTPIQGSAADILKLAMVQVDKLLANNKWNAKLLLQVHDELIFEIKDDEIEVIIPLIEQVMDDTYQLKDVKIEVHHSVGKNWYEL